MLKREKETVVHIRHTTVFFTFQLAQRHGEMGTLPRIKQQIQVNYNKDCQQRDQINESALYLSVVLTSFPRPAGRSQEQRSDQLQDNSRVYCISSKLQVLNDSVYKHMDITLQSLPAVIFPQQKSLCSLVYPVAATMQVQKDQPLVS